MNVLDLFSGIGGFSLGLERASMKTVAFCECDPYCQAVLRKHWPNVPVFGDVRTLTAEAVGPRIDLICGGFPCQDISIAGRGAGLAGERSGLWSEFAIIIGEVRPRYAIVENVSALLGRGIGRVLGDLASLGYDAEWHCIPAAAVGAPHRRDRVWIIAYADGKSLRSSGCAGATGSPREKQSTAQERQRIWPYTAASSGCSDVDGRDANGTGLAVSQANKNRQTILSSVAIERADWWLTEPDVGRVAHGVPNRVDRLRALGNAIVPQIAEIIGRAILTAEL